MKIHAVIEKYPPMVLAGSELAAHTLFRWLVKRGHEVSVHVTDHPNEAYRLDGVRVIDHHEPADVVFTQLFSAVPHARRWAAQIDAPLAYWLHANARPPACDLLITCTDVLAERYGAGLVLHPPVFAADYRTVRTQKARFVTRVGLSQVKGGGVFWDLAERIPEQLFLGVVGGWGRQIIEVPAANTQVWGPQREMRDVYEATRILIMPSDSHETYGRVGVEALASGIPVVAHPNPGVVEALGDAAIWVDRDDIDCYEDVIRCLRKPGEYRHHSRLARKRSLELDPWQELEAAEQMLVALAEQAAVAV